MLLSLLNKTTFPSHIVLSLSDSAFVGFPLALLFFLLLNTRFVFECVAVFFCCAVALLFIAVLSKHTDDLKQYKWFLTAWRLREMMIYKEWYKLLINQWFGGQGWNWTTDTRIFSPLLYRLSYPPKPWKVRWKQRAITITILKQCQRISRLGAGHKGKRRQNSQLIVRREDFYISSRIPFELGSLL